jgi:hypothetical protein
MNRSGGVTVDHNGDIRGELCETVNKIQDERELFLDRRETLC